MIFQEINALKTFLKNETDSEGNIKELSGTLTNSGIKHEEKRASEKSKTLRNKERAGREPSEAEQIANVVTFSRQKLAMLTCKYDSSRCGQCGKSDGNLKHCSKCKTAVYCSRDCQARNWQSEHKAECREIIRLKEIVPEEEGHGGGPEKEGKSKLLRTNNGRNNSKITDLT